MKIAIAGAAGRMGRVLTRIVNETPGLEVAGGIEPKGSAHIGSDMGTLAGIGTLDVAVTDNPQELLSRIDGVIDFTVPAATLALVEFSAEARLVHVIGTTGINDDGEARIGQAARQARIIKSGNFSLGVNLLTALVRKVAATLGDDYDIEVLEMHHKHKIDAPSGTALMLGRAAAEGRGIDLKNRSVRSRDGHTGARTAGDIGFATLRGGSVIGEHTVMFAGETERIELTHKASSRDMFAKGAVKAALWGLDKQPGLYSMNDVLGLE